MLVYFYYQFYPLYT